MDLCNRAGGVDQTPHHPPLTDARKTLGATAVLAMALQQPPTDIALLDADATLRIGPGWTLMAALQWLTGSKARAVLDGLLDQGTYTGLSKARMQALAQLASRTCADGFAGGDAHAALALLRSLHSETIASDPLPGAARSGSAAA